jgi:hypothetical protein
MYDHVDNVLALAATEIASRLCVIDALPDDLAPGSLEACTEYFHRCGRVGVSAYFAPERLFGTPEACQAFDAWHDLCHIKLQASFDLPGEIRVNDCQQAQLRNWWRKSRRPVTFRALQRASEMLAMNNVGRLEHWLFHHNPPENPRSFAQGYLAAKGFAEQPRMCDLDEVIEQFPQEARAEVDRLRLFR